MKSPRCARRNHDWRDRNDGVRFVKDKSAKLRRQITEHVTRGIDYELKENADKDPDFFERATEDIVNVIVEEVRQSIRKSVQDSLNRQE